LGQNFLDIVLGRKKPQNLSNRMPIIEFIHKVSQTQD